ncbi:D-methionine ABC transporter permease [Kaistia sp. 32K]|uniref:methionine ABC transporter permease n=1 Tax=Kaistia sp. 32K TaxID=2795690 RepID=UPI0019166A28|nr:methionine ABC transporter permease [Kaistia sp. 32K]BCP55499.1 D-methionine ABC transporter permease [Kaistia sp. 32K]
MFQLPFDAYAEVTVAAAWETVQMVAAAGLLTLLLGLPIAILLIATGPGGVLEAPRLNRVVGAVINAFRSTPFIILLVALIPITRFLVGTSIGLWAAVVPITVSATPFFARVAEVGLREIDHGLIEAAEAMGARRWQIIWHVLLPEGLPAIIGGFTVTLVSVTGMSAMAGVVGGGGLGDLAIRYGYQRFDTTVMITVIAILIALVSIIQVSGDRLARRLNHRK